LNVNIHYTINEIAIICKGKWLNKSSSATEPLYLSLDSRKISFPESTIFFAIKNEQQNANLFLKNLYERGVTNFVTDQENIALEKFRLANIILVNDTVSALQKLAIYHRNKFLKRMVPLSHDSSSGKFTQKINGKTHYTMLFVVMIMLAATDIVFALDSIPAVFSITQNRMVVYTSNIFAVLGLRSLFFLLRSAVEKFKYLKEGIAIVLIFIGVKMLISYFGIHLHIAVSLLVIVLCLGGSILFSIVKNNLEQKKINRNN
jgi:predicted tellurium resistance membrane protein TerC